MQVNSLPMKHMINQSSKQRQLKSSYDQNFAESRKYVKNI